MARPPLVPPGPELTAAERTRFARHLLLPDLGVDGQRRLRAARVLVVGAGGLGSPALLYLAAAGVGTIGVVDDDVVEATNLQRQVVHGVSDVGRAKVDSAAEAVAAISPDTVVVHFPRAARRRERAVGGRRLRPRPRRGRQLPDALPRRRRLRPARGAARVGVGVPVRRTGLGLVGGRGALLRLRLPGPAAARRGAVVRGRRGARGRVRVGRVGHGDRGGQARDRGRRGARRAAARPRRAAPDLGRGARAARPGCAVCGEQADASRPLGWATERTGEDPVVAEGGRPSIDVVELARLLGERDGDGSSFTLLDVREPGERDVAAIPRVGAAAGRSGACR